MPDDVYLGAAVRWSRVAAAVRAARSPAGGPARHLVLGLPRELAWCHLLHAAGRPDAAARRLRAALGDLLGADLLDRLRAA